MLRPLEVPCILTQTDFDRFAELSGDHNPIHVDPAYAARTAFGATVAHGMLLYTRVRGLMAQAYPGWVQQSQTLMFPAPSYADEVLSLVLEEVSSGQSGVQLRVQVRKPDGRLGLEGVATLSPNPSPMRGGGEQVLKQGMISPLPRVGEGARRAAEGASTAFDALRPGDTAHIERSYHAQDLCTWAALAQAHLPSPPAPLPHVGEGGVPEPLIAALFSYLLGEQVPGHGTNYLKQSLLFHAQARVDEPLDARVTITRLRPDKALVNLSTQCTGEGGRTLCSGEALVLFPC